jgi:hypothetical protein
MDKTFVPFAVLVACVILMFILCALRVACVHYYYYYDDDNNGNTPVSVAQLSIKSFKPEFVTHYRIPYIIDERFPDMTGLLDTVFNKYEVMRREINSDVRPAGGGSKRHEFVTRGMYTILHSAADEQALDIITPRVESTPLPYNNNKKSKTNTVTNTETMHVKLSKGRVVILPPHYSIVLNGAQKNMKNNQKRIIIPFRGTMIHAYDFSSCVATSNVLDIFDGVYGYYMSCTSFLINRRRRRLYTPASE